MIARGTLALLASPAMSLLAVPAKAQTRAMRVIVAFAPGGQSNTFAARVARDRVVVWQLVAETGLRLE